MQLFIHDKLSAPRYRPPFQYAWLRCSYADNRPMEFENPVDFCFNKLTTMICQHVHCDYVVALKNVHGINCSPFLLNHALLCTQIKFSKLHRRVLYSFTVNPKR